MVLHAEEWKAFVPESLQRVVVQIHVRQFNVLGVNGFGIDGEVVIMSCDLHLSCGIVAHRVIAAMMSELELVGAAAESQSAKLVSKADAKYRHPPDHVANSLNCVIDRLGIAGPVGQEHAVRL